MIRMFLMFCGCCYCFYCYLWLPSGKLKLWHFPDYPFILATNAELQLVWWVAARCLLSKKYFCIFLFSCNILFLWKYSSFPQLVSSLQFEMLPGKCLRECHRHPWDSGISEKIASNSNLCFCHMVMTLMPGNRTLEGEQKLTWWDVVMKAPKLQKTGRQAASWRRSSSSKLDKVWQGYASED